MVPFVSWAKDLKISNSPEEVEVFRGNEPEHKMPGRFGEFLAVMRRGGPP